MLPQPEQEQQRNPPGGPGPQHQGDAVDEGPLCLEERQDGINGDQLGAGIGADGGGAHHHPQQRADIVRLERKEEDAVAEQGDEDAVEHQAQAPQHVHLDLHVSGVGTQVRHQRGAQQYQRLGTDDGDQPTAVHDVDVVLVAQEGEHAEGQIQQQAPDAKGEAPAGQRQFNLATRQQHLPDETGGRHEGEEAEDHFRVQQIVANGTEVADRACRAQADQDHPGSQSDREQCVCEGRMPQQPKAQTEDACSHHQGEVAGVQSGQTRPRQRCDERSVHACRIRKRTRRLAAAPFARQVSTAVGSAPTWPMSPT